MRGGPGDGSCPGLGGSRSSGGGRGGGGGGGVRREGGQRAARGWGARSPSLAQGGDNLGLREGAPLIGGRRPIQDGDGVHAGQVGAEGLQSTRVELAQRVAELVDLALAGPDQILVRAGQDLDRSGKLRVAGDGPVVVAGGGGPGGGAAWGGPGPAWARGAGGGPGGGGRPPGVRR